MNNLYVLGVLHAAVAACAAGPAAAQTTDYPNRAVRIIVPQAAGGGVDIVARAMCVRPNSPSA